MAASPLWLPPSNAICPGAGNFVPVTTLTFPSSSATISTGGTLKLTPVARSATNADITTYDQNSYSGPTLLANTTYYWEAHAKAGTLAEAGNWAQGSFTTAAPCVCS